MIKELHFFGSIQNKISFMKVSADYKNIKDAITNTIVNDEKGRDALLLKLKEKTADLKKREAEKGHKATEQATMRVTSPEFVVNTNVLTGPAAGRMEGITRPEQRPNAHQQPEQPKPQ